MTAPDAREPLGEAGWREANARWLCLRLARLRVQLQRRALLLQRRGPAADALDPEWLLADEPEDDVSTSRDARATTLLHALGTAEARLEAATSAMRERGRGPALLELAAGCGLGSFEEEVLVLCLAPALDASFERLYAALQGAGGSGAPTVQLALSVFLTAAAPRVLAGECLHPLRPLRRYRLVEWDDAGGPRSPVARPLRVAERVLDYVRGANRLDDRVAPLLRPAPRPLLTPAQAALARAVEERITSAKGWPVVNLIGARDGGPLDVAAEACARVGLAPFVLDLAAAAALAEPDRRELHALLEREAVLLPAGVIVDVEDASDPGDPRRARAMVEGWIERLGAALFLVSRDRWPTDGNVHALRVPRSSPTERHGLWDAALAGTRHALDGELQDVAQQFDLGPRAMRDAVDAARERAEGRDGPGAALAPSDLWDACRERAATALEGLAQRVTSPYRWPDIVLPADALAQLREIAVQVEQRAHVYERWGFSRQLARGRGITALFAGPSGTGKTMAAEILANHLRLDLYRVDLSGVVSKWVGETEKNLRRVFDAAERSGAVLLFDEADALFGTRTEVKDSHDRYANIEVNYLLQRMEDYGGLAVLATNRRSALDPAFLRRLRFLVEFPFPGAEDRRRIWELVFPPEAAREPMDWAALSGLELAGGGIRSTAVNAAFLAAGERRPIGMEDVLRAARREFAKLEKPMSAVALPARAGGVR